MSATEHILLRHHTAVADTIIKCRSCNNVINGSYCGNCGLPLKIKRVDAHYIIHELQHILHFEKGILFTIKGLLTQPGQNIREFITDNRSRLVKPILFIIITSLVYTTTNHLFHIEKGYISHEVKKGSAVDLIFSWVESHYGYANIIMGIFIALWTKLFFRKYHYNIFEILILLCFVMGMGMLIFSVFALVEGLTEIKLMGYAGIVGFAYCTWAIGQFFTGQKAAVYFKAFIAYLLGIITFSITALLLGFGIDFLSSIYMH